MISKQTLRKLKCGLCKVKSILNNLLNTDKEKSGNAVGLEKQRI